MNKLQIELNAVIKLRSDLLRTDHLTPHIPDNDKTPVWDGFVILNDYTEYTMQVPVQVKGSTKKDITYSVRISDLQSYYHNGGAIFFLILMRDLLYFIITL